MRGTESGRVEKEPGELSQMMQNQKVNYFHDLTSILKISIYVTVVRKS